MYYNIPNKTFDNDTDKKIEHVHAIINLELKINALNGNIANIST